jgi:hypothetical protein
VQELQRDPPGIWEPDQVGLDGDVHQDGINLLEQQTNDVNRVFLAKWKSGDIQPTLNADDSKRRAYLQAKYQEKRWYSKRAAAPTATATISLRIRSTAADGRIVAAIHRRRRSTAAATGAAS